MAPSLVANPDPQGGYMAPGIIPIRQLLGLGFSTANLVYLWYSLSIYLVFRL